MPGDAGDSAGREEAADDSAGREPHADDDSAGGDGGPGEADSGPSAESERDGEPPATAGEDARRQVPVPQEVFRVVVVFSTVLALLSVLAGFTLLDAATRVLENPTGSIIVGLVRAVFGLSLSAVQPHLSTIALLVGLAGVGAIGLGAWIYAVGTRFRAGGMGKHKEVHDEDSDDG